MNGKVLMLAIIFFGGFHVFYAFNRVQNFANIMYRLCAIQLGECLRELINKVQLHTAEKVIKSININSQQIEIPLSSVKVGRLNYPYNCFTLDLANNTGVEQSDVSLVTFNFPVIRNTSVSIFLQGKSLACDRQINAHKFFSSGDHVTIIDLGLIVK